MFKNRVRTAALAGAIAIATGISGLATPAFAVETTQQDLYNVADGSAAQNVTAENITEDELKALTGETAKYLETFQERGWKFDDVVAEYINLGQDGFDPSEEAAQIAFAEARDEASTELATASANIQKARASVLYALEKDEIATADYEALKVAVKAYADAVNPLIKAVNDANETRDRGRHIELPNIDLINTRGTAEGVYRQIVRLEAEVAKQAESFGIFSIDRARYDYVTREHILAFDALEAAVNERAEGIKAAYDKSIASNREAQRTDVLVRQLFLERATAQRDTLRAVQAYFSVITRYVELYQDDELVGDGVLSTEYREVLDNVRNGINYNVRDLNDADRAAHHFFLSYWTDRATNDESEAYEEEKLEFATQTYKKIFVNGKIWQEQLKRVELIDQGIIDAFNADQAKAAADADHAAKIAAAADAIAKALEGKNNDDNDDDVEVPAKPSSSSFKLSS